MAERHDRARGPVFAGMAIVGLLVAALLGWLALEFSSPGGGVLSRMINAGGGRRAEAPKGPLPLKETQATVSGRMQGTNGESLPRHWIRFLPKDGGRSHTACSDGFGFYSVWVPEGEYQVDYYGLRGAGKLPIKVGEVSLPANRASTFEVVVPGDRSLSGRFTLNLPGEAAQGLEGGHSVLLLELRDAAGSKEIVAAGTTWVPGNEESGIWPSFGGPRLGDFQIDGIPPGTYSLRVELGTNSKGETFFLAREIDLTKDDVVLDAESLEFKDFRTRW